MYYFDYAAATPLSPKARKAMEPYLSDIFYNPSAAYLAAQGAKDALEAARKDVAAVVGAKSSEIIFTAGGTEADNLAIHGVMSRYPDANILVGAIEHEAVLEAAKPYEHKIVPVLPDGRIDCEGLKKLIDDRTVLVSIMYANNEIGTIQPLAEIAKLIKRIRAERQVLRRAEITGQRAEEKRQNGNLIQTDSALNPEPYPLFLHTDASQAPNYLHILANTLGVDLMSLNAGKIYGPKETGALYVKTGIELEPLVRGGGQERGLRSGTQNIANIAGFAAALKEAHESRLEESKRMLDLQKQAIILLKQLIPNATINGAMGMRLPNNIHITVPGTDNERLLMELDEKGFMVAAGSACSASSDEPSHVLKAIGLSDADARSSLRITMGSETTLAGVKALITTLAEFVKTK